MKRYSLLSIFVFIIFCPICVHAQAEKGTLSLQVQGSAQIKRNDVAGAREEAIQNALEKAILEAASKLSAISVKDENFQLIKSIILNEPDKYIFYYTITEENRQQQDFMVKANVVVALSALKNDLHKMGFLHTQLADKTNIRIFLTVTGVKSYSAYLRLKEFLQSRTKLVKNIYPGRFEWQEAHFEIDLFGDAQSFADELEQNGGCAMEISHPGRDRIEMVCRQ